MYNFAYIFGVLLLSPLFFAIVSKRRDLLAEMLIIGTCGGLVAFAAAPYFFGTYWSPITLFNWKNSIEDFLFGFFLCSESAGIYSFITNKHFINRCFMDVLKTNIGKVCVSIILAPVVFFALERFTNLNPIYSSMISVFIPLVIITLSSKVLLKIAAITGCIIFLYSFLFYLLFIGLFPGIISDWWNLKNISGILLFGIPAEELVWFTLVGMFCSVAYKYMAYLRSGLVER